MCGSYREFFIRASLWWYCLYRCEYGSGSFLHSAAYTLLSTKTQRCSELYSISQNHYDVRPPVYHVPVCSLLVCCLSPCNCWLSDSLFGMADISQYLTPVIHHHVILACFKIPWQDSIWKRLASISPCLLRLYQGKKRVSICSKSMGYVHGYTRVS